MACRIGLTVGESFAEARVWETPNGATSAFLASKAANTQKLLAQSRWYLPRKSLTDGFRDLMQAAQTAGTDVMAAGGCIFISTTKSDRALEKAKGQSPAVLISSGFESWFKLAENRDLPVESDLVFGVDHRSTEKANGLALEDLEFLEAKFKLLKTRAVAIAFTGSHPAPEAEQTATRFFREKGYHVYNGDVSEALESRRWRKTIENAYGDGALEETRAQIDQALKTALEANNWSIHAWSESGLQPWASLATARGGLEASLSAMAGAKAAGGSELGLHLGLERFGILQDDGHFQRLELRATRRLMLGAWPFPVFSGDDSGFEPGPMLFGKSQQPTFLDVLFTLGRLQEIDGFSHLISEKSKSRILESLLALSRVIPRKDTASRIDATQIAEDLETSAIDLISVALSAAASSAERPGAEPKRVNHLTTVHLSGALSPTFAPLLGKRRPDLRFVLEPGSQWREADACCATTE